MAVAAHLSIHLGPDGSWDARLGAPGRSAARATLARSAVEPVLEAANSSPSLPALVHPGRDVELRAWEESVGRSVASLLTGASALHRELSFLQARATLAQSELVLVVDSDDATIRELPWELASHGLDEIARESIAPTVVARLAASGRPPSPPPRRAPALLFWAPDRDDDDIASAIATVREAPLGGVGAVPVADGIPETDGPLVLHVICHGERTGDLLALGNGAAEAAGTIVDRLSAHLARADLVVLLVCGGGDALPRTLDGLADRAVRAGARSCVAATGRVGREAVQAFVVRLHDSLSKGSSLASAIEAGRRDVRALGMPAIDSRWHRFTWVIDDIAACSSRPFLATASTIDGWPAASPCAARLVSDALALAEDRRNGFVGIEHLVLAAGASSGHLAVQLAARRQHVEQHLASLEPREDRPVHARPTPRLVALGEMLDEGFDVEALITRLRTEASAVLTSLLGSAMPQLDLDGSATRPRNEAAATVSARHAPATTLEVLAGPEDGRRITPVPGEAIGRWSRSRPCEHALYRDTDQVDRSVSRPHLRWLGPGSVEALKPIEVLKALAEGTPREVSGAVTLRHGDIVVLGESTRLLALADPLAGGDA